MVEFREVMENGHTHIASGKKIFQIVYKYILINYFNDMSPSWQSKLSTEFPQQER